MNGKVHIENHLNLSPEVELNTHKEVVNNVSETAPVRGKAVDILMLISSLILSDQHEVL